MHIVAQAAAVVRTWNDLWIVNSFVGSETDRSNKLYAWPWCMIVSNKKGFRGKCFFLSFFLLVNTSVVVIF